MMKSSARGWLLLVAACGAAPPMVAPPQPPPEPVHSATVTAAEVAPSATPAPPDREPDPPTGGPVAFTKPRFVPGEAIDAQITLPAPLFNAGAHTTFSIEVKFSARAHPNLGTCTTAIDGTTKEGAQVLVSRTFTASVVPKLHDEALLATGCESDLRRVMEGQDAADVLDLRGELRLLQVNHDPLSMKDLESTVASGVFLVDLSGGRDAIDRGVAALDAMHEREHRDAIPNNRMPKSKLPILEPAAMQAVKESIEDGATTEFQPLRVVVTEREWTVERATETSVVLRRSISGTVAFRRADKTCFSEDVTFEEEFDGVRYLSLQVDLPTRPSGDDLLCENVLK